MASRELLVTQSEFKWLGSQNYYFSTDSASTAVNLVCALIAVYLGPAFFHSMMKILKSNNMNLKFYNYYSRFTRFTDLRIPHTSFSVLDGMIIFVWTLLNVAFVDPVQFPGQIGLLAVANSTIVLLPIFRNSIVSYILSIPFERSIKYHRWLGRGIFIIVTLHAVGYWYKWFMAGIFVSQLLVLPNMFAHIAWLVLLFLTITSSENFRRNFYEFFFYSHFSFILYFIFATLHFPTLLPFIIPGFCLYSIDRLLRYLRSRPPNDDVQISVHGSITRIKGKRLGVLNYEPGQYCYINIPAISKLQWHPISLGSSPNDPYFTFYVKNTGSWTRSLQSLNNKSPKVKIDGPYGSLKVDHLNYDVIMMCAAGIGVSSMISVIRDLHYKISVNMEDVKKIYLFWTMRDSSLYHSLAGELADIMNSKISSCFNICVWVTQPGNSSPIFIHGKPDWPSIFQTVRDTHSDVDRIAVLSCGPPMLINNTWDCCSRFSTCGLSFDFHSQTYDI